MEVYLWAAQAVLALIFAGSGFAKSIMSRERMAATGQTGAAALPLGFVRFIAVCEILGAAGLILPVALSIDRFLTPLAAIGLAIIMVGAAVTHYRINERKAIVINAILFALCVFVASVRR
ncbi:MAG: DoxX family protein [Terracidiphilus sp.]